MKLFELCTIVLLDDSSEETRLREKRSLVDQRRSAEGLAEKVIPRVFQRLEGGEARSFTGVPWTLVIEEVRVLGKESSDKDLVADTHYVREVLTQGFKRYTELFRKHCAAYIRELNARDRDLDVVLFQQMSIAQAFTLSGWVKAVIPTKDTPLEPVSTAWENFARGRSLAGPKKKSASVVREWVESGEKDIRRIQLQSVRTAFQESLDQTFLPWKQRMVAVERQEQLSGVLWEKHIRVVMEDMHRLGTNVNSETTRLKELVRNGILGADNAQIKAQRRKRLEDFVDFFKKLEANAPVEGKVLEYLQKWYEIFKREDIPKREDKLERLQAAYIPVRAQAIRARYLEDWVKRIEDKFLECQTKLTATVEFYKGLELPHGVDEEDLEPVKAVVSALEGWQAILLELLAGVKSKLGDAMDIENDTSASTLQADADSLASKILATATTLEEMQYAVVVYGQLNDYIARSDKDPADALADFVKKNTEEHKYHEGVPSAYHRAEREWQKMELAAITQLEAEVEDFVAPLMRPFEGEQREGSRVVNPGGTLFQQGAKLVEALKREQNTWAKYNPPVRVDVFALAEHSGDALPAIAKRPFRLREPMSIPVGTMNQSLALKCRMDSKDIQDLLYWRNAEAIPFLEARSELSLKAVWRLGHLLYFSALISS